MAASLIYVTALTNRFNQAAGVSPSSTLIAFGSSGSVALWELEDSEDTGVSETLPGKQGLITCVKFLADDILLSANDMGSLSVWRREESQAGKGSLIFIQETDATPLSVDDRFDHVIVTGASDSLVKIWKLSDVSGNVEITESQTINLKGKLPLVSALSSLPQTNALLLAIAGTDAKVQVWVRSDDAFVHSATLAGHEDWVRGLAFKAPQAQEFPLVLASGSQDATIRLWNIEPWKKTTDTKTGTSTDLIDELLDSFEASLGDLGENEEGGKQISLKHHVLTIKTGAESPQQFSVTFDALLIGHEAGVTSLTWSPAGSSTPTLLSTSTDSSVILWSPSTILNTSGDSSSSIWINRQRFGDVGGQRLGGFVGGLWAKGGNDALAWGWAGGWRRWRCDYPGVASESWNERGAITGHKGPVKGLDWSPDGKYLISAGLDQTTRIHGPVHMPGTDKISWHEIARPQVHGYDLLDVVFISPLRFASIADEKVVRVFEAPRNFVELAVKLDVAQFTEQEHERPLGANVPPLGLSNKATSEGAQELVGGSDYSRRPFDSELASVTLWPETEKIFGHGYESITLGISNSRKLIATACKATSAEHAVVRVYDITNFTLVGQPLQGHVLTVTRIAFSPDDKHILTVSRDRSWRLFKQQAEGYLPAAADKSHGRIIWDCGWSAEGDVFATASRDKTVKIWRCVDRKWKAANTIKTPQPATAVAFSPENAQNR
ncbi:unnamed protein product [Cyclocybe aegerita]|uniref:Elongator complex protein 2 n=1 Tax=Cyclocybe aegerita TaxID=1973307 RepID=A0A8S0VQE6_CYCAE|nr:unnamed protein product [Cyclocybe aegerita]